MMQLLTKQTAAELASRIRQSRIVLLADESGIDSVILLAEALKHELGITPLVFIESTTGFAQRVRPSTIMIAGLPHGVIATLTVLDQQGIPARLCHEHLPGCYDGSSIDLTNSWLATLDEEIKTEISACVVGRKPLHAAAKSRIHCSITSLI
jgi:dihydroorotate dehydrogenase electron transfer subunit